MRWSLTLATSLKCFQTIATMRRCIGSGQAAPVSATVYRSSLIRPTVPVTSLSVQSSRRARGRFIRRSTGESSELRGQPETMRTSAKKSRLVTSGFRCRSPGEATYLLLHVACLRTRVSMCLNTQRLDQRQTIGNSL